jgi:hypothetical protein
LLLLSFKTRDDLFENGLVIVEKKKRLVKLGFWNMQQAS